MKPTLKSHSHSKSHSRSHHQRGSSWLGAASAMLFALALAWSGDAAAQSVELAADQVLTSVGGDTLNATETEKPVHIGLDWDSATQGLRDDCNSVFGISLRWDIGSVEGQGMYAAALSARASDLPVGIAYRVIAPGDCELVALSF